MTLYTSRILPVALLLCGTQLSSQEDSVPAAAIDALFAPWDRPDSPGASVAIIRDGEIIFSRGYGCAQLEYLQPITKDTVFHVASVSKQFTAAAICLLAEEGKLALADNIRSWIPSVPDFGSQITLQHLLNHTSGLRDQWQMFVIGGGRMDDVITTNHILAQVARGTELNFPPGDRFMYCNTGYTLLGEVVARSSGLSLREYCEQEIFAPLGMQDTHFHDNHQELVAGRAYSYEEFGTGYQKTVLSYANAGATSLFTTAEDLARWQWSLVEAELGSGSLMEELQKPTILNSGRKVAYGLGLFLNDYRGAPAFGHGGADAGFRSDVFFLPEMGLGFVVLSNLAEFSATDQSHLLADLFLGRTPATPLRGTRSQEEEPTQPLAKDIDAEQRASWPSLCGYYDLSGTIVRVWLTGERLMAQALGEPRSILQALGEGRFKSGPASLAFATSKASNVMALTLTSPVGAQHGLRLESAGIDLTPFLGRYFSEEAGTYYDIREEQGLLFAQHPKHGAILLKHQNEDLFQGTRWFFGSLQFERNEESGVSGFRLSSGRVSNLLFKHE